MKTCRLVRTPAGVSIRKLAYLSSTDLYCHAVLYFRTVFGSPSLAPYLLDMLLGVNYSLA